MKLFKWIAISCISLLVLLLVVALFARKTVEVKRSVRINLPIHEVFDHIRFIKNQEKFSKWALIDTAIQRTYSGVDGEVGFFSSWKSNIEKIGEGQLEIKRIISNQSVEFEVRLKKPDASVQRTFLKTRKISENVTEVSWIYEVKLNFPSNLYFFILDFDKLLGTDFQEGLNTLKVNLEKSKAMSKLELGAFSVSLSVKDIHKSKEFYEKLGFEVFGGNSEDNWLILKNGSTVIGLFQGMFPTNTLTFNPGWDQNAAELKSFTDVRKIQEKLKSEGIQLMNETDGNSTGPAHIMLLDPDGNPILIDQHR